MFVLDVCGGFSKMGMKSESFLVDITCAPMKLRLKIYSSGLVIEGKIFLINGKGI